MTRNMVVMYRVLRGMGADSSNHDESGLNKTIVVGGNKRRRWSSQTLFRPVREGLRKKNGGAENSRCWADWVASKAIEHASARDKDTPEKKAKLVESLTKAAETFINQVLALKSDGEDKKNQLIRFTSREAEWIIEQVCAKREDLEKGDKSNSVKTKVSIQEEFLTFRRTHMTAELALGGRFMASQDGLMASGMTIEAARFISHGISVNETVQELDDFTAVDDKVESRSAWTPVTGVDISSGSAHMNHTDLSSDLMLLEGGVHIDTAICNFNGDIESALEAIRDDLLLSCWETPRGKQKTCFSKQVPVYASIEVLNSEFSHLNAFLAPISPKIGHDGNIEKGQDEVAIARLREYRAKAQACWPLTKPLFIAECCISDDLPKSIDQCVAGAEEFIRSILANKSKSK